MSALIEALFTRGNKNKRRNKDYQRNKITKISNLLRRIGIHIKIPVGDTFNF